MPNYQANPEQDVLDVVEADPHIHTAIRWWPPTHPRWGEAQANLIGDTVVELMDGTWCLNLGDKNQVDPGDWIIMEQQDDGSVKTFSITDAGFKLAYRVYAPHE